MYEKVLILATLLPLANSDASPQMQLAGFDDLFALATGNVQHDEVAMRERGDRSLTNTFPFNQVAQEIQRSYAQNQPASLQTEAHIAPLQASAHSTQLQATARTAQLQANPHSPNLPSSTSLLDRNAAAAGFHLLAGFGSRTNPWAQYQIGSPSVGQYGATGSLSPAYAGIGGGASYQTAAASYTPAAPAYATAQAQAAPSGAAGGIAYQTAAPSYAPVAPAYATTQAHAPASHAPVVPSYSPPEPAPSINVPSRINVPSLASVAPSGGLQCPAAPGLPISQCQGAVNTCWSVGVQDVDCPNNALCCFDGCVNTCYGKTRAVVVPEIKVKPQRKINPAQKRRKTSQTFEDVAAAGQKCVEKIEQVEEIEYDEQEECTHSYDKKCHTTYSTEYESQQEEECEDNYKKSCEITYSPRAQNVTVQVCMTPLVKDCNLRGPEVCRTEYISECWTKNDPHVVEDDVPSCTTVYEEKCVDTQSGYVTETDCKKWPKEVCSISKELKTKYNPVTKCEKVPQELCGPAGCGFSPGPEQCHDEVKTVVTDIPEEVCDLQPRRQCSHVTKLVPKLTPVEECVDVPKEVCQKSKGNPRTVLKPVTKKWCYTPTAESGLH